MKKTMLHVSEKIDFKSVKIPGFIRKKIGTDQIVSKVGERFNINKDLLRDIINCVFLCIEEAVSEKDEVFLGKFVKIRMNGQKLSIKKINKKVE